MDQRIFGSIAAAALVAGIVAALWLASRRASAYGFAQDECSVSECGPDGVPLSRYAG